MPLLSLPVHTRLTNSPLPAPLRAPLSIKRPSIVYKCRPSAAYFTEIRESSCRLASRRYSDAMTILKQGVQLDVELKLPVQILWDAIRDIESFAPKINLHSRPKLLEGNGGVGSISLMEFADGRSETERVDVVDEKTHTLVSTVIAQESSCVYNDYTKTMFLCPNRDGTTTIARWKAEFAPSSDGQAAPAGLSSTDSMFDLFKALESYLTAPPAQETAASV